MTYSQRSDRMEVDEQGDNKHTTTTTTTSTGTTNGNAFSYPLSSGNPPTGNQRAPFSSLKAGFSFGTSNATPQKMTSATFSFGTSNSTPQKMTSATTFSFGTSNSTTPVPTANATTSGSLFGTTTTTTAASAGGFGSLPPRSSGSIFGTAAGAVAPAGGLTFGPPSSARTSGSLFSTPATTTTTTTPTTTTSASAAGGFGLQTRRGGGLFGGTSSTKTTPAAGSPHRSTLVGRSATPGNLSKKSTVIKRSAVNSKHHQKLSQTPAAVRMRQLRQDKSDAASQGKSLGTYRSEQGRSRQPGPRTAYHHAYRLGERVGIKTKDVTLLLDMGFSEEQIQLIVDIARKNNISPVAVGQYYFSCSIDEKEFVADIRSRIGPLKPKASPTTHTNDKEALSMPSENVRSTPCAKPTTFKNFTPAEVNDKEALSMPSENYTPPVLSTPCAKPTTFKNFTPAEVDGLTQEEIETVQELEEDDADDDKLVSLIGSITKQNGQILNEQGQILNEQGRILNEQHDIRTENSEFYNKAVQIQSDKKERRKTVRSIKKSSAQRSAMKSSASKEAAPGMEQKTCNKNPQVQLSELSQFPNSPMVAQTVPEAESDDDL